ncbi:MAG TPA: M4 family metallopeptidase [Verrucomicrobiales bacterium]|nr:M4 family metallopeptidase [Verrucomicrobiales bacterium]
MKNTSLIRRAAPFLAALALGLTVFWLTRPRANGPSAEARVIAQASNFTPPPAGAQPPVTALLAQARQFRVDPNAAGNTPWTTNLHPSGVLRFVGMEPGWSLGTIDRKAGPGEGARKFVLDHREAWGLTNPRIDMDILRHRALTSRDVVRLQQTYGNVPVFAAQLMVHVAEGAEVTCVSADPGLDFKTLDSRALPLTPKVSAAEAAKEATAAMYHRNPVAKFAEPNPAAAKLIVYAPEVLGFNGEAELAWDLSIESEADSPVPAAARWIVSAETGETLNSFNLLHSALSSEVYDCNSATMPPVSPARMTGDPATGNVDVDNAHDFIRQVYNFYLQRHGRDSFNAAGATIIANVRQCSSTQCPWQNAVSGTGLNGMGFGADWVTDDILAHEFTHKVTEFESGLLYQNASGAMNESFSDIWGELFDQSNTGLTPSGTDTVANRWLIGEDLGTAIRSMSNPPAFSDPDRITSGLYTPSVTYPRGGTGPDRNDDGGVHSNSGVCNKLCFLLADGENFNGFTIAPIGPDLTLALFYEVNVSFLTPAADWLDLNFALRQAAINLIFQPSLRAEVGEACDAVEISTAARTVHMNAATNAALKVGIPEVDGIRGPYTALESGIAGAGTGGTLKIQGSAGPINVDRGFTLTQPVTIGTYDTFIAVSGATGTPVPPAPVILQAP